MKKILLLSLMAVVLMAGPAWSLPFTLTAPTDSIVGFGNTSPNEDEEKQALATVLELTVEEVEALYLYDKNDDIGINNDYKDLSWGFNPEFAWDYAIVKVNGPGDYWYIFMDDNASGFLSGGDDILTTPAQGTNLEGNFYFNEPNRGVSHVTFFRPNDTPPTGVPEPATLILLGLGLLGIAGFRRKK